MVPDYSFELYFPLTARVAVLGGLEQLCTPDTAAGVAAARRHEREAAMNIVLALPPDDALTQWRRDNPDLHRGVAAGEVHIGFINLWIKRDAEGRLNIRLWPPTRAMQTSRVRRLSHRATHARRPARGPQGYRRRPRTRRRQPHAQMWPNDALPPGYEHELAPKTTSSHGLAPDPMDF